MMQAQIFAGKSASSGNEKRGRNDSLPRSEISLVNDSRQGEQFRFQLVLGNVGTDDLVLHFAILEK